MLGVWDNFKCVGNKNGIDFVHLSPIGQRSIRPFCCTCKISCAQFQNSCLIGPQQSSLSPPPSAVPSLKSFLSAAEACKLFCSPRFVTFDLTLKFWPPGNKVMCVGLE